MQYPNCYHYASSTPTKNTTTITTITTPTTTTTTSTTTISITTTNTSIIITNNSNKCLCYSGPRIKTQYVLWSGGQLLHKNREAQKGIKVHFCLCLNVRPLNTSTALVLCRLSVQLLYTSTTSGLYSYYKPLCSALYSALYTIQLCSVS